MGRPDDSRDGARLSSNDLDGLSRFIADGRTVTAYRHYNAYTREQKRPASPVQREAKKRTPGLEPTVCGVSGFSDTSDPRGRGYIFTHLEDYTPETALEWLPCSKLTHRLLHNRFVDPRAWFDFVARHYHHGAWFTFLVMSPAKMVARPGREPYWSVYPKGLPKHGEFWTDYADACGISADLFRAKDVRDIIRFFWSFPVPSASAPVDPPLGGERNSSR